MDTTLLGVYILLGILTFLFVSVYGKMQVKTSLATLYALLWPVFWLIVLLILIKDNIIDAGKR